MKKRPVRKAKKDIDYEALSDKGEYIYKNVTAYTEIKILLALGTSLK